MTLKGTYRFACLDTLTLKYIPFTSPNSAQGVSTEITF